MVQLYAADVMHTVPGYILLVNELLSPGNCFHGLKGQEAIACQEREEKIKRAMLKGDVRAIFLLSLSLRQLGNSIRCGCEFVYPCSPAPGIPLPVRTLACGGRGWPRWAPMCICLASDDTISVGGTISLKREIDGSSAKGKRDEPSHLHILSK